MAVSSRPSLRQTAGNTAAAARTKRDRHASAGHGESDFASKKLKLSPRVTRNVLNAGNEDATPRMQTTSEQLPIRSKETSSTKGTATRKPDPVLVQTQTFLNSSEAGHRCDGADDGDGGEDDRNLHRGINQNIAPIVNPDDRRSLRSHDGGARSKSELAQYFHNYDEIVSIAPRSIDVIDGDTILHISDRSTTQSDNLHINHSSPSTKCPPSHDARITSMLSSHIQWTTQSLNQLNEVERIDLSTINKKRGRKPLKDPLDDSIFIRAHAKEERKEKQLRNIEKERAMHEKSQLERLLEALRGHDWLRVMGINGITETEKRVYEPKRDFLIGEVRLLLEKFRLWKEEEKRRKSGRESLPGESDADADDEEEEEGEDEGEEEENGEEDESDREEGDDQDESGGEGDDEGEDEPEEDERDSAPEEVVSPLSKQSVRAKPRNVTSTGPTIHATDPSDTDASAARQLHREALMATQLKKSESGKLGRPTKRISNISTSTNRSKSKSDLARPVFSSPSLLSKKKQSKTSNKTPPNHKTKTTESRPQSSSSQTERKQNKNQDEEEKADIPFISFFAKPYLRAAAIGNYRRSERSVMAFGQPIPETSWTEFDLPDDIFDARKADKNDMQHMDHDGGGRLVKDLGEEDERKEEIEDSDEMDLLE